MKQLVSTIIKTVKKKKELTAISDDFVKEQVFSFLKKNPKIAEYLENRDAKTLQRSEKYKNLVKKVRAELRKSYGLFSTKEARLREKYLAEKDYDSILKSHISTKERMRIYPLLYKKIWEVTGMPESIIDLGCGMNPFSFKYMRLENMDYLASDISKTDCDFIQNYFDAELRIRGKTTVIDVLKSNLANLPKADMCFLFKLLDPALVKNRKTAERIIDDVPAKWVVASFSTKTIGARKMKDADRNWILKMCEKKDYAVKVLKFENEIFYVIQKWK